MNAIQEAVNEYTKQGFSVIPCGPDKRPLVAWAEYQARKPTKSELRDWFGGDRPPSIGVVCGEVSGGLVVVDLDDLDVAQAIACDLDLQGKTTLVETPSGGCHVWLRAEGHCRPLKAADGAAIGDLKASGGYVIAPPSPGYRFISQAAPLAVPDAWAWASETLKGVGVDLAARQNGDRPAEPLPGRIPVGQRNASLASLAGSMRRRGASEAAIFAALLVQNGECEEPLPQDELSQIARSVGRYTPADLPVAPMREPHLGQESALHPVTLGELKERTAAQLLEGEGETLKVDFLPLLGQDGFVVRGWSHILASYPKTGKTELLADAVGKWTGEGLRVLYFTEEPETVWRLRLQARPPAKPENLTLVFALLAGVEAVEARIAAGDEDVVIVDTTRNVLGLEDEKDNSAIARTCGPLIAKCRLGDKTLIFAHHHIKAGGEYGRGIAGGHAFLGIVDVALEINREKMIPNRRRLEGQARIVTVPALLYEMTEDGTFTALGAPEDVSAEEVQDRVGNVLTDEWQLTGAIRKALDDPEKPTPSSDSVLRALDALARRGEAERKPPISEPGKRGTRYLWRVKSKVPL
jgi:hypothetical protein